MYPLVVRIIGVPPDPASTLSEEIKAPAAITPPAVTLSDPPLTAILPPIVAPPVVVREDPSIIPAFRIPLESK
jgi:hypothetical protein